MTAPTNDPRPLLSKRTLADLAHDPRVVLDLARMLRKVAITLYDTQVCPDPGCGFTSANPDAMTLAELSYEEVIVDGALRGWSAEETHGALSMRAREHARRGPHEGVPAGEPPMIAYRDLSPEVRKHFSIMRSCVEHVAGQIANSGWERDRTLRGAWMAANAARANESLARTLAAQQGPADSHPVADTAAPR